MNVLLTSAGRRVALLRAFMSELDAFSPGGRVLAGDASPRSAAFQLAHQGVLLPRCTAPEYVEALLEVVRRYAVRVIVPLIDTELQVLAANRRVFGDAGCDVMVSDERLIAITRDKRETARYFSSLGFRTPRSIEGGELGDPKRLAYPLFVKPAAGSSSIDASRVLDPDDLRYKLARIKDPVVQTLEAGDEYTIDVFADDAGRARCAVPRRRWETRAGEISKGVTAKDQVLISAALRLVDAMGGCRGCVTLQCFRQPDGTPVFFEANLRFGGGYPLSYAAGANFPRWVLQVAAGQEVPDFDGWRDGMVMLRYDDAVFLEKDPSRP